jgi:septal ring-binding cell division protein DamX
MPFEKKPEIKTFFSFSLEPLNISVQLCVNRHTCMWCMAMAKQHSEKLQSTLTSETVNGKLTTDDAPREFDEEGKSCKHKFPYTNNADDVFASGARLFFINS